MQSLSVCDLHAPSPMLHACMLASRFGPEQLLHRYGLPRPHFLTGTCLFAAATAMGCAFASYAGLYAASIFTGELLCFPGGHTVGGRLAQQLRSSPCC